jgi:hypothetical protein
MNIGVMNKILFVLTRLRYQVFSKKTWYLKFSTRNIRKKLFHVKFVDFS